MNYFQLIIILVIILLVTLGPLLTIWALNTLFPILAIPYALKTWFASLVLFGAIGGVKAAGK